MADIYLLIEGKQEGPYKAEDLRYPSHLRMGTRWTSS